MRAAKQKEMGNKAAGIVALATGGAVGGASVDSPMSGAGKTKLKRGGKVHGCATGGRLDRPARKSGGRT